MSMLFIIKSKSYTQLYKLLLAMIYTYAILSIGIGVKLF